MTLITCSKIPAPSVKPSSIASRNLAKFTPGTPVYSMSANMLLILLPSEGFINNSLSMASRFSSLGIALPCSSTAIGPPLNRSLALSSASLSISIALLFFISLSTFGLAFSKASSIAFLRLATGIMSCPFGPSRESARVYKSSIASENKALEVNNPFTSFNPKFSPACNGAISFRTSLSISLFFIFSAFLNKVSLSAYIFSTSFFITLPNFSTASSLTPPNST